jgi:acetyl esterase/lipase
MSLTLNFESNPHLPKPYCTKQDLTDAVTWAVEKGYADPKRTAIFGGSYGGYATLAVRMHANEQSIFGDSCILEVPLIHYWRHFSYCVDI